MQCDLAKDLWECDTSLSMISVAGVLPIPCMKYSCCCILSDYEYDCHATAFAVLVAADNNASNSKCEMKVSAAAKRLAEDILHQKGQHSLPVTLNPKPPKYPDTRHTQKLKVLNPFFQEQRQTLQDTLAIGSIETCNRPHKF